MNNIPKKANPSQTEVEIWKVAIQTQMHFNELLIKSRATVVTVALAAIGATAIALRDTKVYFQLRGIQVHIAVVILALSIVFLVCQFIMDYYYYLRLLLGAVEFTNKMDEKRAEEFGLTKLIIQQVSTRRAQVILFFYYWIPIALGVVLALAIQFCTSTPGQ